jgi:hypothetical protein
MDKTVKFKRRITVTRIPKWRVMANVEMRPWDHQPHPSVGRRTSICDQ